MSSIHGTICLPMGRNISGQALSVCGDAQMLV
jgi:hypothetical protein